MDTPLDVLKKYWNYDQFRQPQEEIINAALNNVNSIVLLPTGGGKSMCYQIPALLLNGVCIVISPLIALIQDQVSSLKAKNINAIALTSQLSEDELIIAFDNLQFGNYQFLYLSPEKLQSALVQEKIKQLNVSLIAIDEAHCISEWGHDFRPSYLQLPVLKELQPKAPIMALTATATEQVLVDIRENLQLTNPIVFKKSFQRENLCYTVLKNEDVLGRIIFILKKITEPSIIYAANRKQTKEISRFLNKNNLQSSFYHGGLSVNEKLEAYNNWMSETTPIMVATNAFGMGIDKHNVRAVIHINIPDSLENFIQEAGRAGRDGKKAHSIVVTNESLLNQSIDKYYSTTPSEKFIKKILEKLHQFYNIALGDLPIQSFNFSIQEFCSIYQFNVLKTYNSLKILEREGVISLDENYRKKSSLKIDIGHHLLLSYIENHPYDAALLQLLLRSYGGVFDHFTTINEFQLSQKLKCSKAVIVQHLKNLQKQGIIKYSFEETSSKLIFLITRDDYTINRISKNIKQQNRLKFEKLTASINYLKNSTVCRNIQLLAYFNEIISKPCNQCDICLSKNKKKIPSKTIIENILNVLNGNTLSSKEIIFQLNFEEENILKCLKILLEENKITITSQNKFKIIGK